MKMRHLHYFLIVAEELSFTRTAARVHIEPSPLSRAMSPSWVFHSFNGPMDVFN